MTEAKRTEAKENIMSMAKKADKVWKRGDIYTIPQEMKQNVRDTHHLNCPKCKGDMTLISTKSRKDEFYCKSCHISAPLFSRK